MKRFFKKMWPKSLAGQLIVVLMLALIVAQLASFAILHDDRRLAFIFASQQNVISRTVSVVRLLNTSEPGLHPTIVSSASSRRLRFKLSDKEAVSLEIEQDGFNRILQKRLAWELGDDVGEVRVAVYDDDDDDEEDAEENDGHNPFWVPNDERRFREWRSPRKNGRRFRGMHHRPQIGMTISIATKSAAGSKAWLNVYSMLPRTSPAIAIPSMIAMGIMAFLLFIIVILMVRRVARPLAQLADNAERFGRGEDIGELLESGPEDVRKASRAFNEMQERLTRFVQDRTRMLAAITHDLRTPITSLRIRAEMIEDDETREKILETLLEMQNLTEAALDFARHESSNEETRNVDLVALVDSLCEDLADVGQAVEFINGAVERLPYACHPLALKRAFRNVIENAVRYGAKAEVDISLGDREVWIRITDQGPGLKEAERERVFEPFVRLEESRNRETGGIGLGLAIARTVIRSHGGDITISDGVEGGAVFSLCLPLQD